MKKIFIITIQEYDRMGGGGTALSFQRADNFIEAFLQFKEQTREEYCEDYWGDEDEESWPHSDEAWIEHIEETCDGGDYIEIYEICEGEEEVEKRIVGYA